MEHADLPSVSFSELDGVRYLHLGDTEWVQGAMRMAAPADIELEYVRRMMAWLLFVDPAGVARRHAMQLGLGAAAITRFCRDRLGMRCTAVELNPQVVTACRAWFHLPPDDARLQVVIADARSVINDPAHRGTVDALAVDIYDDDAAAPVLDGAAVYAACRELLTPDGVMTVNLFGRSAQFDRSRAAIAEAFGARAVWSFRPTREGNTVVLAQRRPSRPPASVLLERTKIAEGRWGIRGARRWPRLLSPLED